MIPKYGIQKSGFQTDSLPPIRGARSRAASRWQAGELQPASVKAAFLLAVITALAIFSAPCTVGFSATGNQAVGNLSPASISFGTQDVGTSSAPRTVILSNTGRAALRIARIAITGTNAGSFTQSNNCSYSVAAGASCRISVTFIPVGTGTRTGTLSISEISVTILQQVTLSGIGAKPVDGLSPTSLSFGNQSVGTTGASQNVTLSNSGTGPLNISSLVISGTNAGDFAQSNTCGSSVAAGGSCTISVTFTPLASGSRTASVSITDNASGSPQAVSLSGTGTAPVVSLSSTTLPFGNQTVGTTSTAQSVTLSNTGNGALYITSLAITGANAGDFAQTNTCGSSVAAGGNCVVSVTFKPSLAKAETASVSMADNASGSPQAVSLSGTGTAPAVSLSSTSLSFGNQAEGTTGTGQSVTLSNSGNGTLYITSLAVTGANAGDFAQTNTCGSSVAAGGNCTISVTFKPSLASAEAASVSIADSATGSPQAVSLSGTGTAPEDGLSPSSLSFGNQSVGTTSTAQTATLSNTGNGAMNISSLTITGTNASDFAQTNTCGSSVAAGGNCTISVTFKPSASGSRAALVSITDNASGSPQTVSLSGTGTAASVTLSSNSLSFGNQAEGTTSTAQSVTLTNGGNATLSITSVGIAGTNASDFAQTNTCGSSVAAGGNCTISVTFKPSLASAETASISVADSASGSPQAVSLSGTGTAASVTLSSSSLSFGNQAEGTTSTAQSVTLTNGGNATLTITSVGIAGTNASDFAQTNTCGSSVAAGGTCTISVTFKPSLASAEIGRAHV